MSVPVKRGYRVLRNNGLLEFAKEATVYGLRRLPEHKRIAIQSTGKRIRSYTLGDVVHSPISYIYVDPHDIRFLTPPSEHVDERVTDPEGVDKCIFDVKYGYFDSERQYGAVVPGDWDRRETRFEDLFIYRSIHDRFARGLDWTETDYLDRIEEFLQSRERYKGYTDIKEIKNERLPYLDRLYSELSQGNYKHQSELDNGSIFNSLTVNIGSDGEILFNSNGAHRLAMSKVAGLDTIPALVIARHENWVSIRRQYQNGETISRQFNDHPDIKNIDRMLSRPA